MTGLVELTACCTCTISQKPASWCVEIKLSTKLIWQRQSLTISFCGLSISLVFSVCLILTLLSISLLKKTLISPDLFLLSYKVLLSPIFILANLRIVDSPSPLSATVLFFKCLCNFQQPDLLVHNFLEWLIIIVRWALPLSKNYLQPKQDLNFKRGLQEKWAGDLFNKNALICHN